MKLKRLVSVVIASVLSAGSVVGLGSAANAVELKIPNDTVKIEVIADGTHNGQGTETFVNNQNGYNPGDNTSTDGVVASGDFVTYKVTLGVVAGPARTLSINFSNLSKDDRINLSDFSNLRLDSSVIQSEWEDSYKLMKLTIPRGMAGTLSGTVIAQAKDSLGLVSKDNKVSAELSNGRYSTKSVSKPITVVSAPLADLTISGAHSYGTPQGGKGSFKISPHKLTPEGYSSAGVSSEANWITDINVSEFPEGTTWSIDGTDIPVKDGKLKDVSYSGVKYLNYTLSTLPQKGDSAKTYKIWLEVSPDSFSVDGGLKNVADPGNDKDESYDTSSYTLNGSSVGAKTGRDFPNNNYSRATWFYQEVPKGAIYGYYRYAPTQYGQTIYEDGNIHWANDTEWVNYLGRYLNNINEKVTSDNDIKNESYVALRNIEGGKFLSDVTITDTLDTADGGAYQKHSYDPTKKVVVKLGDEVLSPAKYKVEWLVGDEWVESDSVVSDSKSSRVTFPDMTDYALDSSTPNLSVNFPVKALGSYDNVNDEAKLLQSTGSVQIRDGNSVTLTKSVPLSFPKPPKAQTFIKVTTPAKLKGTSFSTEFKVVNDVVAPPVSEPYTMTSTITLHDVYDASTFKLTDAKGWEVQSISGKTVVLTKSGNLQDTGTDTWSAGSYTFTVDTIVNPNDGSDTIDAPVSESLEVSWGKVGSLEAGSTTSKSSTTQPIGTSNSVYSSLKSIEKTVEIKDTVSWESTISVGKLPSGKSWSQDIVLPYNGDVSNMKLVNQVNKTNISIDPKTGQDTSGTFDGIGRSKFNGDYILDSVKFSAFAPDTKVTFYDLSSTGAKSNPVTRTVNSDGTIDMSGLGNKKALTIASSQNLSDLQSAGAKLTFSIKPSDNRKDDAYVAWMGKTTAPAGTSVSWPDDSTVVASSVSGYVFEDADKSYTKDKKESSFSGVTVQLQENVDGNWTQVSDYGGETYSTKTDSDGYYSFANLRSGKYRVVLPNVAREPGTNVVSSVNGSTGVNAKEGDLSQAFTNRFNVTKPTVQTVSYKQVDQLSSSNPEVSVAKGSALEDVNFGYLLEKSDLTLDKSPATVTNSSSGSTVKWTVDVTNTGKTPIEGAKLFDRTSKEVAGFQGTLAYKEIEKQITGKVLFTTGRLFSNYYHNTNTSFAIVTTDGIWVVQSISVWKPLYIKKIDGVTGTPLGITGQDPAPSDKGSVIATTDGYWLINITGSKKLDINTEGDFIGLIGIDPTRGFHIATTKGYYMVDSDLTTCHKIEGITGRIISGNSWSAYLKHAVVLSTDGVWVVDELGKPAHKITEITGTPRNIHLIKGNSFIVETTDGFWLNLSVPTPFGNPETYVSHLSEITGTLVDATNNFLNSSTFLGIATTDGYWLVDYDANVTKISEITGIPLKVVTSDFGNQSAVLTTEGYWFVNKRDDVIKVQGITGTPVMVTGDACEQEAGVLTTDGFWIVSKGTQATKVPGVTGYPIDLQGVSPISVGALISTTDGSWFYFGLTKKLVKIGEQVKSYDAQGMSPTRTQSETNGIDKREWVNREYELPTIAPGQTVTATFTGFVPRDKDDFVVANQSWVTSPSTPREGIESYSNIPVTGKDMSKGTPDIPLIPKSSDMKTDGIEVRTSSINNPKDVRAVDDLSDQTPALVPALPGADLSGSISGTAWYDSNKDGLRDNTEPTVSGMKVTVRNATTGEIAGETTTDDSGKWTVDRLPVGTEFNVQYESLGWVSDGKTYTATKLGTDASAPNNSDADYSGLVVKSVTPNPTSEGYADLGLVEVNGDITITKGILNNNGDADAETDIIKGENSLSSEAPALDDSISSDSVKSYDTTTGRIADTDDNSATQAYSFRVANSGSESVGYIKLTDQTTAGLDALIGKSLVYKTKDGDTSDVVIGADGYVKKAGVDATSTSLDENLIMEPGSQLLGYFHVGFSEGNENHSDSMTVTASVVDSSNNPLKDLKSTDQFTAKYELVKAKLLKVEKVDGSRIETKLANTSFKIESTANNSLDDAEANERIIDEVGTFRTDSSGAFSTTLKSGVYKITETSTPFGYLKPNGAWYLQLSYDGDGNQLMSIRAVGNNPYGDAQSGSDNNWGTAQLRNDPMTNIPSTGGLALWVILGGITLLGIGSVARKKVLSKDN